MIRVDGKILQSFGAACGLAQRLGIFALVFVHSAPGVVPLVTDDADTVDPQKFQLSVGGLLDKTAGEQIYIFPANLVMGVSARGEVSATYGHQWRDGVGTAPDKASAQGSTDLLLATKWQLWRTSDEAFKLSTLEDLPPADVADVLTHLPPPHHDSIYEKWCRNRRFI